MHPHYADGNNETADGFAVQTKTGSTARVGIRARVRLNHCPVRVSQVCFFVVRATIAEGAHVHTRWADAI